MKHERLIGASGVALSLLLLAGCGSEQDIHDSKVELPANVRRQVGGHVLQLVYQSSDKKTHRATAVRVAAGKGKTMDITAAHAVAGAARNCASQTLLRKTETKGTEYFTPYKQSSAKEYLDAVDRGRSMVDRPQLEGNDIAGIVNDSDSDRYGGIKAPKTLTLDAGDELTFVNYQQAPSGTSRDIERTDKYGQPAEFTGTYIGREGTKLVALVGNGTSYGSIDDKRVRAGSSGGAVFANDKRASFVGISVVESNYSVSHRDVQERFGVDLNVPGGSRLAYVEPVTASTVQKLYQAALNQPECTKL